MNSSSFPSLLNLDEFPVTYSVEFDCSESNLKEVVDKVASFTSKVYAIFPASSKERREQLKEAGVVFSGSNEAPTPEECEQFEETLKKKIITVLNQKEKEGYIQLLTDYYPEEKLCEIAESAFKNSPQLTFLFPQKTCTKIFFNKERTKLGLNMNFKGPGCFD